MGRQTQKHIELWLQLVKLVKRSARPKRLALTCSGLPLVYSPVSSIEFLPNHLFPCCNCKLLFLSETDESHSMVNDSILTEYGQMLTKNEIKSPDLMELKTFDTFNENNEKANFPLFRGEIWCTQSFLVAVVEDPWGVEVPKDGQQSSVKQRWNTLRFLDVCVDSNSCGEGSRFRPRLKRPRGHAHKQLEAMVRILGKLSNTASSRQGMLIVEAFHVSSHVLWCF